MVSTFISTEKTECTNGVMGLLPGVAAIADKRDIAQAAGIEKKHLHYRPLHSILSYFLLDAGVISMNTFEEGRRHSAKENYSFGSYLVLEGKLSYNTVKAALTAMRMVLDGAINRIKAISLIQSVHKLGHSFWTALDENGLAKELIDNYKLSLGEILVESGLVAEMDMMCFVEFAIQEKQTIGTLLVEKSWIKKEMLQAALKMQNLARSGAISKNEACLILRSLKSCGAQYQKDPLRCRHCRRGCN